MSFLSGKPLRQVTPPSLPQPRVEYNIAWQDQYSNVLRLYFNQLNNITNTLISPESGGASLFCPNGSFASIVDQTLLAVDTPKLISFEQNFSNSPAQGVVINGVSNTQITVLYSGVYWVSLNLQLRSTNASAKDVTVWLRRNSVDMPNSARRVTVSNNGGFPFLYAIGIEVQANDILEAVWAATDTNVTLNHTDATGPYPRIPSAIISVAHVSNVLLTG